MTSRSARLCFAAVILALILIVPLVLNEDNPIAAGAQQLTLTETVITGTLRPAAYLPLIRASRWVAAPLVNGGFELDWSVESSNRSLRFSTDGTVAEITPTEIKTPPGWITWFKHGMPVEHDPANPVGWAQPHVGDAFFTNPDRMRSGAKGQELFTFMMVHDAGFLQRVTVSSGEVVRLSGWAHAWSHNGEAPDPDRFAYWSEGSHVGYNHFSALVGTPDLDSSDRNFTFWLGIDPTGETNPYAGTVVWGHGAHIYNAYQAVPSVTTTAQGSTVTVFLRSRTLWPFNNNNAYWDDITLEVLR